MKTKLIRKGDIAVVLAIVIAAVAFWAYLSMHAGNLEAVITVDGNVIETVDLSAVKEKRVIKPDTLPEVVIVAENGEIYFEKADCEDKLCVNCGKLSRKGDTAVCLPAKTVVTVSGADADVMTY